MTQKYRAKISLDHKNTRRKNKYYKEHAEGYGFQNGDFCFSDRLDDWMYGKHRKHENFKPLF